MNRKEDQIEDGNVPVPMQAAQRLLDSFAEVSSDAAYTAMGHSYRNGGDAYDEGAIYLKRQVLELLTANPPLATVPGYFNDGRANYLWYSDFFDDAGKECFKRYMLSVLPSDKITSANYAEELARIDLPYFKELVRLVSLLKQIGYTEKFFSRRTPAPIPVAAEVAKDVQVGEAADPGTGGDAEAGADTQAVAAEYKAAMEIHEDAPAQVGQAEQGESEAPEPVTDAEAGSETETPTTEPETPQRRRLTSPTRSYEPNMTEGQYSLVVECINTLEVFKSNITIAHLRDLLAGKQPRLFHVMNQKRLTYLFDLLAGEGYIGNKRWISVAGYNCDFASVPKRGKDIKSGRTHYITAQQFTNCRHANQSEAIKGLNTIEDLLEQMKQA